MPLDRTGMRRREGEHARGFSSLRRCGSVAAPAAAIKADTPTPDAPSGSVYAPVRLLLTVIGFTLIFIAEIALVVILIGMLGAWEFELDAFAHVRPQAALIALAAALALFALRDRIRALQASVIAAIGFAALWPVWRETPKLAPACVAETLRVAVANVHGGNPRVDQTVAALVAEAPDLLATLESDADFMRAANPLRALYPHQSAKRSHVRIWSKRPFTELSRDPVLLPRFGHRLVILDVAGRKLGFGGVHMRRPMIDRQEEDLDVIGGVVAALPRPTILVGDFNATPWSHAMGVVERETGLAMIPGLRRTWRGYYPNPINDLPLPALIGNQIDHILLSPELGASQVRTFALPGSVHYGVSATVQIPKRAPGC